MLTASSRSFSWQYLRFLTDLATSRATPLLMNRTGGAFARSRMVPWLGHDLYKPGPQVWVLLYTSDICRDALAEGKRSTLEVQIEISSEAQKLLPTIPTLGMGKLHLLRSLLQSTAGLFGHLTAPRLLGFFPPKTSKVRPESWKQDPTYGFGAHSRFYSVCLELYLNKLQTRL